MLQRPVALVKICGFNWIATIFPTEKSRNDTGFIFRQPEKSVGNNLPTLRLLI
ncbi:MAG: hypothetical protein J6U05_00010 [Neisseriaceae bacterium]|nr:hypothetical protein [Neisseriaceae bacterium]